MVATDYEAALKSLVERGLSASAARRLSGEISLRQDPRQKALREPFAS